VAEPTAAGKCGFGRSGNGRDLGPLLHSTVAATASHEGMIGLARQPDFSPRRAPRCEA
jgi:hypothetical protein